jgi:hypothetical protein
LNAKRKVSLNLILSVTFILFVDHFRECYRFFTFPSIWYFTVQYFPNVHNLFLYYPLWFIQNIQTKQFRFSRNIIFLFKCLPLIGVISYCFNFFGYWFEIFWNIPYYIFFEKWFKSVTNMTYNRNIKLSFQRVWRLKIFIVDFQFQFLIYSKKSSKYSIYLSNLSHIPEKVDWYFNNNCFEFHFNKNETSLSNFHN